MGGGQTDKYTGKNVCNRRIDARTNRRTDARMNGQTLLSFSLTDKRGDGRTRRGGRRDERGTQWRINNPRGP